MKNKHICFIVDGYPTIEDPSFTFVRQLIVAIADEGVKCSVIAPQSITNTLFRKKKKRPFHWLDITKNESKIDIYQPKYISISNLKINSNDLTDILWKRTVIKVFKKINIKPDILYGHFWHCGLVAAILGEQENLPVFIASGESKINVRNRVKKETLNRYLPNIKGVISVSTKNMLESLELKLTTKEKIRVIPNAIDSNKFHQKNKAIVRNKLGFNEKDFIVAFTGTFDERKGVLRLAEAVKEVGNVKTIFIGSGIFVPEIDGILFCGRLPHEEIPDYLNAADVFVLPTLAEGCSNAIIEAMACGLPIISSDRSFNDDILNKQNSIRVDSKNIEAITDAIKYLKDYPEEREKMSNVSYVLSKEFYIENRAKKIINYIEQKSGD